MVTDNTGDELDSDQQTLDQEQGITTEGEGGSVPTGPTNQQLQDSISALTTQNRGLQSKIDTGLNAIRNDTQAWAASILNNMKVQQDAQATKEFLGGLDEDQRPLAEGLLARINQQPAPQPEQAQPAPVENRTQQIQSAWEPVVAWAEGMGLSRSDSRIQWSLMADGNQMPDQAKQNTFRDHIIALRSQDLGAATPTATSAATPVTKPQGDNPPIQETTRAVVDLRTVESVRDAYIAHEIPMEEYKEKMRALGEPA